MNNFHDGQRVRLRFLRDLTLFTHDEHENAIRADIRAGDEFEARVVPADSVTGVIPTFDFVPFGDVVFTVDFESYPDCFEVWVHRRTFYE